MGARGILLVDHGSRSAAANGSLEAIAALVRDRLEDAASVAFAHMELAPPSIPEGIALLVSSGAAEIVVVPYFLGAGRHSTEDIPKMVAEAMQAYPGVAHRVAAPLGVDGLLADLVIKRALAGAR